MNLLAVLEEILEDVDVQKIARSVHPLHDQVFIRRIPPPEQVLPSGLVLPQIEQPQWHRALVLSVGPGQRSRSGALQPTTVEVGDVVFVGAHVGVNVKIADDPGGEYVIISERDLLAVTFRAVKMVEALRDEEFVAAPVVELTEEVQ